MWSFSLISCTGVLQKSRPPWSQHNVKSCFSKAANYQNCLFTAHKSAGLNCFSACFTCNLLTQPVSWWLGYRWTHRATLSWRKRRLGTVHYIWDHSSKVAHTLEPPHSKPLSSTPFHSAITGYATESLTFQHPLHSAITGYATVRAPLIFAYLSTIDVSTCWKIGALRQWVILWNQHGTDAHT